jgi:hypothetical protein
MPSFEPAYPYAEGDGPMLNWRLYDEDGNLNWSVVLFGVLAAACTAIWAVLLAQCCGVFEARCCGRRCARAQFITLSGEEAAALLGGRSKYRGEEEGELTHAWAFCCVFAGE